MNMSLVKRKLKIKKKSSRTPGRKKHVETMFLTNKSKKFPYYFKPSNVSSLFETNFNKLKIEKKQIHIKASLSGYLTVEPLKAVVRLYKWFSRINKLDDELHYRFYIFPDFVLTAKPKEVRMGKGKGAPLQKKVAIIKKGMTLVTFYCTSRKLNRYLLKFFLKKIMQKLPFRPYISVNEW